MLEERRGLRREKRIGRGRGGLRGGMLLTVRWGLAGGSIGQL